MTLEEFRQFRDTYALNGYRERWPALDIRHRNLRKRIRESILSIEATKNKHEREVLESAKVELYWELQAVDSEMAAIEADAPVRKARLGLSDE